MFMPWIAQLLWRVVMLGSRKPVNHISWEVIVTPTDGPKSVRNPYVIDVFGGLFVLSHCFFWSFLWV